MKSLGTGTVALSELQLPGNMAERLRRPSVELIAKSLKDPAVGLIERPKVRKLDGTIISGNDRVAAHALNKMTEVEVEFVECTDAAAIAIGLISDAARRHDQNERDAAVIQLVDLWTKEEEDNPPDRSDAMPGRPTTAKGRAQKRVAAATGGEVQSVKRAEKRLAKSAEKSQRRANPDHIIVTLGMELDDSYLAQVEAIKKYTAMTISKLQASQASLTQLLNAELPCNSGELTALRSRLKDEVAILKDETPYSVCPYCKTVDDFQCDCTGCNGLGWVDKSTHRLAPEEALVTGDEAVIIDVDGERFLVSEVIDAGPADWMPGE